MTLSMCLVHRWGMIPELFKILLPRINPTVLEVVHSHLTDEQIGLLLVKLINPYVVFSQQKEAELRGLNRKTLRGMKSRGEVAPLGDAPPGVNSGDAPILPKNGHKSPKNAQAGGPHPKPL